MYKVEVEVGGQLPDVQVSCLVFLLLVSSLSLSVPPLSALSVLVSLQFLSVAVFLLFSSFLGFLPVCLFPCLLFLHVCLCEVNFR